MATIERLGSAGVVAVWIVIVATAWWITLRIGAARRRGHRPLSARSAAYGGRRDYKSFLRAIRDKPGNGWTAASAMAFAGALASERGLGYAAAVVAGTVVALATLGFLAWRWWGAVSNRSHRADAAASVSAERTRPAVPLSQ